MEVIIQVALMFFFVQFLVVTVIMIVALLFAGPEEMALGSEPEHQALRRGWGLVIHLPHRISRFVVRLLHSTRLRSVR